MPAADAAGDGVGHTRKDDRDRPRLPLKRNGRRGPNGHDGEILGLSLLLMTPSSASAK